jgi:hypothetical protein
MQRGSTVLRALFGALIALLVLAPTALAEEGSAAQSDEGKKVFYDVRATPAAQNVLRERAARLQTEAPAAVENLRTRLGSEGVVSLDPLTSTPRMVGRTDGFLTGPSSRPAADIAMAYVRSNVAAFGLNAESLAQLKLVRDYVSIDGTHHLYWIQQIAGVPVFGNGLRANVTKDGKLVNVLGSPVRASGGAVSPGIGAAAAVAAARANAEKAIVPVPTIRVKGEPPAGFVTEPKQFANGDSARQVWFQGVRGLRLAWQTQIIGSDYGYTSVVDAESGAVLYRRTLVNHASGLVFDNYPGAPAGGVQREQNFDSWLTPGATTLTGNNTHVYTDINDDNTAQASEEVQSVLGNWLYPFNPTNDDLPAAFGCTPQFLCAYDPRIPDGLFSWVPNRSQSGTQAFYFVNKFHDHLLAEPIGFTEAAGNFQLVNSTGQGEDGDPVVTNSIDGANTLCCFDDGVTPIGLPDPNHTDNANMLTPPDGQSPLMQMYLFDDPLTLLTTGDPTVDPFIPADGDSDASVVYHEYTHGLSNRLVVDAMGNSTLGNGQAGAMGEAWSDWYAMDLLVGEGFETDTPADGDLRIGNYVGGGADLIRFQPIDCPVENPDPAKCPGGLNTEDGGFTYGDYGKILNGPEVHADGEIWAATLWDLRVAIGRETALSYVTRAMELSPANPSFLDMRNSILMADNIADGGLRDEIWEVFAKRGMGFFAGTIDGDDPAPVEDFQLPPDKKSKTGRIRGFVTDADTGEPIKDAVVYIGGHFSGFPTDYGDETNRRGRYVIRKVFVGTFPKLVAKAPGYDTAVVPITVKKGRNTQDFELKRDWAAASGGASIAAFNGPDYTQFGCGPANVIDQSLGAGWGSDTDENAQSTGNVIPKFVVIALPEPVDISEVKIDPSNTCGDPGSSSTRGYRVETSTDGTTFTQVSEGVFYAGNRNQLNTVATTGPLTGITHLKFWMLNPQVPTDPDPNAACTGPADCGTDPDDVSGVAAHCGPGKDNGFGGCTFMDSVEVVVYGRPGS